MVEHDASRRRVLRSVAVGAVGGTTAVGTATARSGDEFERPVLARGTRTVRTVPTEVGYRREETFEVESTSGLVLTVGDGETTVETERRYRNRAVDGVGTVDLGTEAFEVDERAIASRVAGAEGVAPSDLEIGPEGEPEVVEYEDTAVLGTVEQHYAQERRVSDRVLSSGGFDAQAGSNPLLDARCSTYTYKGDDPTDRGDLAERTGPINLVWNNGQSASEIEAAMRTEWDWRSIWPSGTRYVFDGWDTVLAQDAHVKKNIDPSVVPNQWHVRAYDLPGVDDIGVVGAGHRDPVDHGQTCKYVGEHCDIDWGLAATRAEASGAWTDVRTEFAGNGASPSSRGRYDYVEGSIRSDGSSECTLWCLLSEAEQADRRR